MVPPPCPSQVWGLRRLSLRRLWAWVTVQGDTAQSQQWTGHFPAGTEARSLGPVGGAGVQLPDIPAKRPPPVPAGHDRL